MFKQIESRPQRKNPLRVVDASKGSVKWVVYDLDLYMDLKKKIPVSGTF